ncbi:TetR/AcrR family transcriptional regulator [Prescottella agglutinans]|uniref:TetR/AcrR family transcriptional regulator n=1 Tax=Prescottella agglutinans TaxID=1644129 RepID=UPI003CC8CABD
MSGGSVAQRTVTEPRRRPKNRKAQIAAVAAEAFSERGYHSVSVDDIAATVGISGPALYRHYPNKYALFLDAATGLVTSLQSAIAADAEREVPDAAQRLDGQILTTIRTTVTNRRTAGLYRWESRYLEATDRACIRGAIGAVNRRMGATLAELRPELPERDNFLICVAMLSVAGSITVHRANLPRRHLESLLLDACRALSRIDLPTPTEPDVARAATAGIPLSNKREVLLNESIVLFHARGYHEVSIEDIGAAAGINASGVYRHFASKSDLLAAAFHRAADRLAAAVGSALSGSTTPREALRSLVDVYVRLSFAQSELMSVYFAEIGSLPDAQRTELRNVQRLNVEEWAHLLGETRTELSAAECRFLVHGALSLVLDVGRVMRFDTTRVNEARVQAMMLTTLFGDSTDDPGGTA